MSSAKGLTYVVQLAVLLRETSNVAIKQSADGDDFHVIDSAFFYAW